MGKINLMKLGKYSVIMILRNGRRDIFYDDAKERCAMLTGERCFHSDAEEKRLRGIC